MRRLLIIACVALVGGDVAATPEKPERLSGPVKSYRVLSDGRGNYLVVAPFERHAGVYVGDGKDFHRQRVRRLWGSRERGVWEINLWWPRGQRASLRMRDGERWQLTCDRSEISLSEVSDEERQRIVGLDRFREPLWLWEEHLLARDSTGRYLYVDSLIGDRYRMRLFAGTPGQMAEIPIADVVSDSEGELLIGAGGTLRIDGSRFSGDRSATWIGPTGREGLELVDIDSSTSLVFGELGVYDGEAFGSVCGLVDRAVGHP